MNDIEEKTVRIRIHKDNEEGGQFCENIVEELKENNPLEKEDEIKLKQKNIGSSNFFMKNSEEHDESKEFNKSSEISMSDQNNFIVQAKRNDLRNLNHKAYFNSVFNEKEKKENQRSNDLIKNTNPNPNSNLNNFNITKITNKNKNHNPNPNPNPNPKPNSNLNKNFNEDSENTILTKIEFSNFTFKNNNKIEDFFNYPKENKSSLDEEINSEFELITPLNNSSLKVIFPDFPRNEIENNYSSNVVVHKLQAKDKDKNKNPYEGNKVLNKSLNMIQDKQLDPKIVENITDISIVPKNELSNKSIIKSKSMNFLNKPMHSMINI